MNKKVLLIAALAAVLSVGLVGIGFALANPSSADSPLLTPVAPSTTEDSPATVTPPVGVDPARPGDATLPQPPVVIDPKYPPLAVDPILGQPPISIDPIPGQPPIAVDPILGEPGELMAAEIVAAKPMPLDRPVDGITPPPAS